MSTDDRPEDWRSPRTPDADTRRRLDDVLSLLVDQRRRNLLYHLAATDVTDVDTLAPKVAAVDEDVSPDEVPPEVQKQATVSLVHVHLPKLAEVGAIEFDRRSGAIRCRSLPPVLDQLAETCREIEAQE